MGTAKKGALKKRKLKNEKGEYEKVLSGIDDALESAKKAEEAALAKQKEEEAAKEEAASEEEAAAAAAAAAAPAQRDWSHLQEQRQKQKKPSLLGRS